MTSSIAEPKNHLTRYLRLVRAGETIWVKDRDRIIAKIEPVRQDDIADEEAWMNDLVADGVARAPERKRTRKELETFLADAAKPKQVNAVAKLRGVRA